MPNTHPTAAPGAPQRKTAPRPRAAPKYQPPEPTSRRLLDEGQLIGGRPAAHIGNQFVLNFLSLAQSLKAGAFSTAVIVDEGVLFPALLLDEAVSLARIEPLYRTDRHVNLSFRVPRHYVRILKAVTIAYSRPRGEATTKG
jgi:hypothetical protein